MARKLLVIFMLILGQQVQADELTVQVFHTDGYGTVSTFSDHWQVFSEAWVAAGRDPLKIAHEPTQKGISGTGMDGEDISFAVATATAHPEIKQVRDEVGADVAVVFANTQIGYNKCGAVSQKAPSFLHNNGNPDGVFIDTQFHDDHFVIVLSLECFNRSHKIGFAHEMMHLFGGTHKPRFGDLEGILSDRRANAAVEDGCTGSYEFVCWNIGTLGSTQADGTDFWTNEFSRNGGSYGDFYHDNAAAIEKTSESVAAYRVDVEEESNNTGTESSDPIVLEPPVNVRGSAVETCVSWVERGMWTHHFVRWDPGPSSFDPSDIYYEIWYSQPDGDPYTYGWDTYPGITNTDVYVKGADSRIRFRACVGGVGCSVRSLESYLARWLC